MKRLSKLLAIICLGFSGQLFSAQSALPLNAVAGVPLSGQSNGQSNGQLNGQSNIISGEFSLTNHQGKLVSKSSFDGFYRLVFFGYTRCPDICPTTMARLGQVMQALGDKSDQVKVLFISIDPKNDTSEHLSAYVSAFHPDFIGLSGSSAQLAVAAKGFNVAYGQSLNDKGAQTTSFYHSAYLFLMDEEGDMIDVFGYGTSVERIVKALGDLIS